MSGESTTNPREPQDDVPVEPAAPTDAADAIVPQFEVPEAETVAVPDAESAAQNFDVPPPPTFDAALPVPARPGADDEAGARPSVDEKLTRAALRQATVADTDRPSVAPPDAPTDTGYRGWTIAIFVMLAVLLIGAIVLLVFLLNTAPLPFPTGDARHTAAVIAAQFGLPPAA